MLGNNISPSRSPTAPSDPKHLGLGHPKGLKCLPSGGACKTRAGQPTQKSQHGGLEVSVEETVTDEDQGTRQPEARLYTL